MSKPSLSLRVPQNILNDIEQIQDQEGIEDRSEAARQVLRRGVERSRRTSPGEQLAQQATGIAAVGAVVATLSILAGQAWTLPLILPFWGATFLFAMFWASIRALGGSDLL